MSDKTDVLNCLKTVTLHKIQILWLS